MTEASDSAPPSLKEGIIPQFASASRDDMARIVEALYYVHRLLAAITDLDTLLERITEESKRVARAEASSLMLYDAATEELYFHVALGESGDQDRLKREIRLKMGQGIAGMAAQTRASICVANAQEDPRFFSGADDATQFKTRNILAVPIMEHDTLVGVLEVLNKMDGAPFSEIDRQALEMFSSLAATSVVNARLIEEQIKNARMAAVGQAVTGLSHYTKNIVTGLSSSAELIDLGIESGNVDVLRRSWPVLKRSTKRISNFVQDMLSFSRPRKPLRESCQAAALVEEARETFSELFAQKQVTLSISMKEVKAPIMVDGQAVYRVLLNLLTNAADAAPGEGGWIDVSGCTLKDGALEIRVRDNGPGIAPENLENIFDPFFSTKGSNGTGLGLAVSRKIALEHGGELKASNHEEGGAEFQLVLPKAKQTMEV
jgi:K+-sensing histidine kinase KdpD